MNYLLSNYKYELKEKKWTNLITKMSISFDSYNSAKTWPISRPVKYEKINTKHRFKNICNKTHLSHLKFLREHLWALTGPYMFFFSASNQHFILPRSKVYVFFSHNNHVCRHHRPCLFIIKAEFYMHPRKRGIHSNSSIYQPKYALQYVRYYYTSVYSM